MAEAKDLPDWVNLDLHLAELLSAKLREFAEKCTACPSTYTAESWKIKLESISLRLERYVGRFDLDFERELEVSRQAQEAMHELADIFPFLWD